MFEYISIKSVMHACMLDIKEERTDNQVVSHSQTTIFSFILGQGKIGSGILTVIFLSQPPPVLQCVTIGVNLCYNEAMNYQRGAVKS